MQRCEDITRAVASGALRGASWRRRVAARIHLLMCRACRRYARELRAIGEAVRRDAAAQRVGPDQVERLVRAVVPDAPESRT